MNVPIVYDWRLRKMERIVREIEALADFLPAQGEVHTPDIEGTRVWACLLAIETGPR